MQQALYQWLKMRYIEYLRKEVYRTANIKIRDLWDFNQVRCIKNKSSRILVKDENIKEIWKNLY